MNNYHRHSCYSNIFTPDSSVFNEDYARRAVELNHGTICSCEHGWQGYYHETYELAQKYGIKLIFGAEAYWVKDNREKDKTNNHIILMARNENGRRNINRILSDANEFGYYYKPRVDEASIMSLPADDVVITTACVGFWGYEKEYTEQFIAKLHDRFKDNFFLEVQYHHTDKQKELNKYILQLAEKMNIQLIAGMDSHYIYPEQGIEREYVLESKGIRYDDEEGWFMDYPDDETCKQRFIEQGILSEEQIKQAMDNTDVVLEFEDFTINNPVFTKTPKLPTLYDGEHYIKGRKLPKLTQEERNKLFSQLTTKAFKEYLSANNITGDEKARYLEGVSEEVKTIKETNMSDYFLLDYEIVKLGVENGGVITKTGRGSGASYFTNTLLGLSNVDRFKSPIQLYPARFMSKTRILEANSLPDIDLNVGNPEVFEVAQKEILGELHAFPMIAFGTYKKKAAFKMYARSQNMDFALANTISSQISKYEEALKYADDDSEIDIFDYVDDEYRDYVEKSQCYWGIISDKKKAPCAYLLYEGNIREEIGLIKCKSESTKSECLTTVVDGMIAENYKFLKNDWLKVDTVLLTDMIYKRIGIKPHTVNELSQLVAEDEKVWDLYTKGLTIGVNQCEKPATMEKLKHYQPTNISELAAFIAGIRPGFKSMYSKFASRAPYEYGIPQFDSLIQTEQFPYSYILYQENLMTTLHYAGFPMDECYQIIKNIAKKKPEKVKPLKAQFLKGFYEKIRDEYDTDAEAHETCERIWQIIDDSTAYSFNSSHAYCMALDSLYNAWQKANHPYEFYEVLLQVFSDKGKKDKVAELKREMRKGFGIEEGPYKWGHDNRLFRADPENGVIYPALVSVKGMSKTLAKDLYQLSQKKHFDNFYDLWKELKTIRSCDVAKITKLIKIGYFAEFGSISKLLKFINVVDIFYKRTQFSKTDAGIKPYMEIIKKHCETETDKLYRKFNADAALHDIWESFEDVEDQCADKLRYELEVLGYVRTVIPEVPMKCAMVIDIDGKYANKNVTLYRIGDGSLETVKVRGKKLAQQSLEVGQIIKTEDCSHDRKWRKSPEGKFYQIDEYETILTGWTEVK